MRTARPLAVFFHTLCKLSPGKVEPEEKTAILEAIKEWTLAEESAIPTE
jgi:hypothetical protein